MAQFFDGWGKELTPYKLDTTTRRSATLSCRSVVLLLGQIEIITELYQIGWELPTKNAKSPHRILFWCTQAPFIWSRVAETTPQPPPPPPPPPPGVTLADVVFSLFLCKISQPFPWGSRTHLGERDNSGNPDRRDNYSSYKRFCSPDRDNSQRGEWHVKLKFRM